MAVQFAPLYVVCWVRVPPVHGDGHACVVVVGDLHTQLSVTTLIVLLPPQLVQLCLVHVLGAVLLKFEL